MNRPVQELIAELASSNAGDVALAAESLCHLGQGAQPAAVALVRSANRGDATARAWVAAALEEVGTPSGDQIDDLIRLVSDPDGDVSFWAATLLGRAGPAAARAVEALAVRLRHSCDSATRERAAWALGRIGPLAAVAVPALHAAAVGEEPRLSRLAKAALAAIARE